MARSKREKFEYEFHSEERIEFVRWLPCVCCGRVPCDNHHVRTEGISRRASYEWIVPLCFECHRVRLPSLGVRTMIERYPPQLRGRTFDAWDDCARYVEELWTKES